MAQDFTLKKQQIQVFLFIDAPGPGTYVSPSEFGHYSAKPKFIKESEKIEKRLLYKGNDSNHIVKSGNFKSKENIQKQAHNKT